MKYLLDNHSLSNRLLAVSAGRNDLSVTEDVAEEYADSKLDMLKIRRAGIEIIQLKSTHLEKMKEVMSVHGDNLKLVRLYTSEGKGDISMLAYALAEKASQETLFPEEHVIVTQDVELTAVAKSYGILCVKSLP